MKADVQSGSEKYWLEHRRALERRGTISKGVSQFEMARQGVVSFLTDPDGLTVSSMKVSLRCPLALTRIATPVKGRRCQHVQCFDLVNFLEYSRRSSKFDCPVCNKPTAFPVMLVVSPYIEYALQTYKDCDEVEIFQDGSMVAVERKQTGVASDDDDEDSPKENGQSGGGTRPDVVDLTLDSDDDEPPLLPVRRGNGMDAASRRVPLPVSSSVFAPNANGAPQPVTAGNQNDIANDPLQLGGDIDFTFRSNFIPWGDSHHAVAVDLGSNSRLTPAPSSGNASNWPVDVIAIDSD